MSKHLMAKMRHAQRPGDQAYPGRFDRPSPERIQQMLNGPRLTHRGQDWYQENPGLTYEDAEQHRQEWYDEDDEQREPIPHSIKLDWREGPNNLLPHVRDEINDYNSRFANPESENSFHNSFWPAATQQTAIRQHGETRYGLDVGDEGFDLAGWLWHWRLHRQTGPDINNPEHWERIDVPREDMPGGEPITYDPESAKVHAERALQRHIDRKQQSRPSIGDYDINQIMRDEGL